MAWSCSCCVPQRAPLQTLYTPYAGFIFFLKICFSFYGFDNLHSTLSLRCPFGNPSVKVRCPLVYGFLIILWFYCEFSIIKTTHLEYYLFVFMYNQFEKLRSKTSGSLNNSVEPFNFPTI